MRHSSRLASTVAVVVLSCVPMAACGGSGGGDGSTSPSSSQGASPVATYASLSGTSTSLTLAATFKSTLAGFGVTPTATSPAALSGDTFTFPITGGNATVYAKGARTPQLSGTVNHSGGLALTADGQKIEVQKLVLTLGAKPTVGGSIVLNGQALGSAITMFDLDTSTTNDPRTSAGSTTLSGATVYVDPQAATALNAALRLSGAKALPTQPKSLAVGTATIVLKG